MSDSDTPITNIPNRGTPGPQAQVALPDTYTRIPFTLRLRDFNGATFFVEVVDSPFGRMRVPDVVPFEPALVPYLSKLGNPERNEGLSLDELIVMGQMIGDMLFPTQVRRLFFRTLDKRYRPDQDHGIRILLEIDDEQLAVLPWEYAYIREFRYYTCAPDDLNDPVLDPAVPVPDPTDPTVGMPPRTEENSGDQEESSSIPPFVSDPRSLQRTPADFSPTIPNTGPKLCGFLALDPYISMIRFEPYIDQSWGGEPTVDDDISASRFVNILLTDADPFDFGKLDVEKEMQQVLAGLNTTSRSVREDRGKLYSRIGANDHIRPIRENNLTIDRLEQRLNQSSDQNQIHILHFSGHAGYVSRSQVSKERQFYSVLAENAYIDQKLSDEDKVWERRFENVFGRMALSRGMGSILGREGDMRGIQNPLDPLRGIQNPLDPLRGIQNPLDPLRGIQNPLDPLRGIQNPLDPLRGIQNPLDPLRGLSSTVYQKTNQNEGLLILEKPRTTHIWQDLTYDQLKETAEREVANLERADLAGVEASKPFYDFISFLLPLVSISDANPEPAQADGINELTADRLLYLKSLLYLYPDEFLSEEEVVSKYQKLKTDSGDAVPGRNSAHEVTPGRGQNPARHDRVEVGVRFGGTISMTEEELLIDEAKLEKPDAFREAPNSSWEVTWKNWTLSKEIWNHATMTHEIKATSLRWRQGSHDVLWANKLGDMLQGKKVSLIVLNSCQTTLGDSRGFEAAGVATTLIQAGIPAVVGMQLGIDDESAVVFSGAFYNALANHQKRLEEALTQGRWAMAKEGKHNLWGVPCLYMRRVSLADNFQLCKY